MLKALFNTSSLVVKHQTLRSSSSSLWKPLQSLLGSTMKQSMGNKSINFMAKRNLTTETVHEEPSNLLKDEDRNRRWLLGAGIAVFIIALEPYFSNKFLDRKIRKIEEMIDSNTPDYIVSDKVRRMTLNGRASTEALSKSDKVLSRAVKGLNSEDIEVLENNLIILQRIVGVGGKSVGAKLNAETIKKLYEFYMSPTRPNQRMYAQKTLDTLFYTNPDLVQSGFLMPLDPIHTMEPMVESLQPSVFDFRKLSAHMLQSGAFGFVWGAARWLIASKRGKPLLPNITILRGATLTAIGGGSLVVINEPSRIFKKKSTR